MKTTKFLIIGLVMGLAVSCQPKKSDTKQATVQNVKSDSNTTPNKVGPNKMALENLDNVLSPFEDMTESALNKNKNGILKAMERVNEATKNNSFKNSISAEGQKLLMPKLEELKTAINQTDYSQIAMVSSEIFGLNINHFIDAKSVENQIRVEHLDFAGYKTLALLTQKNIDWNNVKQSLDEGQNAYLVLKPKVKDGNLTDTFDYLFNGLALGTANKDVKMTKILANMDLTLVDVLEGSF